MQQLERPVEDSFLEGIQIDLNKAIDQIEESQHPVSKVVSFSKVARKRRWVYSAAASLLLIATSMGLYFSQPGVDANFLSLISREHEISATDKQSFIVLEDGTRVWLNVASTLRYADSFKDKAIREVYLEGEAFFDVAEDKKKPFIVSTSGVSIKVLGTAFNVRSYPQDASVETTLLRGKVTVQSQENDVVPVVLAPNEKAVFTKKSKSIVSEKIGNADTYTAWKEGIIVFDDKPFSYILETLERWYGVRIIMEDEHSMNCTFSARFKNKTLQEVLEIFKTTESINYSMEENHVMITGKLCEYN
jgi:transmembrane sensor